MNERILIVGAALILGVVGGFILRPLIDGDEDPDALKQTVVQPDSNSDSAKTQGEARRPRVPARTAGTATHSSAQNQTIEDLIQSVDLGAQPTGTGIIRGHVRTTSGDPLVGVQIVANTAPNSIPKWNGDQTITGDSSLLDRLRNTVAYTQWNAMTEVKSLTDETGAFALNDLPDFRYRLRAELRGYQISSVQGQGDYLTPSAEHNFVATWRPPIKFIISRADGSTPDSAMVNLKRTPQGSDWEHRWSPVHDTVATLTGRWYVDATVDGDNSQRTQMVELDVVDSETPEPIELQIVAQAGVHGRVILPKGISARPEVFLIKDMTADLVTSEILRNPKNGRDTSSRESYKYAFSGIAPGNYLLGVSLGNDRLIASTQVVVPSSAVKKDLVIPFDDPETFVVVRVVNSTGKNIGDAYVQVGYSSSTMSGSGGVSVKKIDGTFLVVPSPSMGRPPELDGVYRLDVNSSTYGRKRVQFDPTKTRELTVKFDEPATVNVIARGTGLQEIKGSLRFAIVRDLGNGGKSSSLGGTLNSKGELLLGPLQNDKGLSLDVLAGQGKTIFSMPLKVKPGKQDLVVNLPQLHHLDIKFEPKAGERQPYLSRKSDFLWYASVRNSTDGRHRFKNIPAGTYVLSYSLDGKSESREIQIPHPALITIE